MSNHSHLLQPTTRTPRTRSQKSRFQYKLHSPLRQHRSILQPSNTLTTPTKPHVKVPPSPFTFAVNPKASRSLMPPKGSSTASKNAAKGKQTKQTTLNLKSKATGPTLTPAVLSSGQRSAKRALSPVSIHISDDIPPKRFKSDALGIALTTDVETASSGGSIPPSSADHSMSHASVAESEPMTVSADSHAGQKAEPSNPPRYSLALDDPITSKAVTPTNATPQQTPPRTGLSHTPATTAARLEIAKTPKAPWLTGSKLPALKVSPAKKSAIKPLKQLVRTPIRAPGDLRFPTSRQDLFPTAITEARQPVPSNTDLLGAEELEPTASSSKRETVPRPKLTSTIKNVSAPHQHLNLSNVPPKPRSQNVNVSAALTLPATLSPTKTPAKTSLTSNSVAKPSTKTVKVAAKPSILQRAGTTSSLHVSSIGGPSTSKSPLSSTLAALMNRNTIDPHAATQAQLSTLNQALEELDAHRPTSSISQQPPVSRPSTSLGHSEVTRKATRDGLPSRQSVINRIATVRGVNVRPGTSLGMAPASRFGKHPAPAQPAKPVAPIGNGRPTVPTVPRLQNASTDARRASTASLALSQSLPPAPKGGKPPIPVYTTHSGRRVISTAARAAPLPSSLSTKDSSMDNMSVSNASDGNIAMGASTQASSDISMQPVRTEPLTVLKDCVIFVDVRTEDGEDAGSLFVDMLRGLGAKILSKPGSSLTHIVYKSGLSSTLTKFRALPEPKPTVVGIGWVVECVEKREKVDVTRYIISLEEEAGSILEGLKTTGKTAKSDKKESKTQAKLPFKPVGKGS